MFGAASHSGARRYVLNLQGASVEGTSAYQVENVSQGIRGHPGKLAQDSPGLTRVVQIVKAMRFFVASL